MPTAPMTITLGRGTPTQRAFVWRKRRNLAQDSWMIRAVAMAGIQDLTIPVDVAKNGEALLAFVASVVNRLYRGEQHIRLLVGDLTPVGEVWTNENGEAEERVQWILSLEDEAEKSQLLDLVSATLADFLPRGPRSSESSIISLSARRAARETHSSAPTWWTQLTSRIRGGPGAT